MEGVYIVIVLAPLAAAVVAGLFGRQIGRVGAHSVCILGVAIAFGLSCLVLKDLVLDGGETFNGSVYRWATVGGLHMEVGFLIDRLTALMMTVVAKIATPKFPNRW